MVQPEAFEAEDNFPAQTFVCVEVRHQVRGIDSRCDFAGEAEDRLEFSGSDGSGTCFDQGVEFGYICANSLKNRVLARRRIHHRFRDDGSHQLEVIRRSDKQIDRERRLKHVGCQERRIGREYPVVLKLRRNFVERAGRRAGFDQHRNWIFGQYWS